ncbi:hypothetical protein MELA_02921, partial [Candidatus Methylomirabilis lanthanidiphila]
SALTSPQPRFIKGGLGGFLVKLMKVRGRA